MSKIRIVFNRSNLDAVCSAAMIINALRNTIEIQALDTVPYSYTSYSAPSISSQYFMTFVIGAFLSNNELLEEKKSCKNLYVISQYNPTNVHQWFDPAELLKLSEDIDIYSGSFIFGQKIENVEESYSSCLSKLTRTCLAQLGVGYMTGLEPTKEASEKMLSIINAVESFVSIKDVSAEQILLVHENYDDLLESAYIGKFMEFKGPEFVKDKLNHEPGRKTTIKGNNPRIFKARNFIQSSMTMQHYRNAKMSMMAQTIQTNEEYLYDVVRLATYPYQLVVVYHDHKHYRHWWIYSSEDSNAEKLVNMIPHIACFTDGQFIHLVSDIPKLDSK